MRRKLLAIAYSMTFLLLLFGAKAQAQYQRPSGDPPTDSDLLAYDGQEKTVIVEIINSTPYDIYLKNTSLTTPPPPPLTSTSVTSHDIDDMQLRIAGVPRHFMFAPVGIPRYIRAAPAEAFHNSDPTYINRDTKPYTMVFSWDDHAGINRYNWVNWTVKQVEYCASGSADPATNKWTCTSWSHGDVDLGLWMYRLQAHPDKVESVFFPDFITTYLSEAVALAGLVTDPLNPLSWLSMALATSDLASSGFKSANSQAQAGCVQPDSINYGDYDCNKLYLASYVIPANNSFCSQVSQGGVADCNPALLKLRRTCTSSGCTASATGDAVASKWEADAAGACNWTGGCPTIGQGPAFAPEAELVVSTHLLRGQMAPHCIPGTSTPYSCSLGRLNLLIITIMRPLEFDVAALSAGSTASAPVAGTPLLNGSAADSTGSMDDEAEDLQTATSDSTDPATAERRQIRLFLLQAGAGPLRHSLKQQGLSGLLTLRSVVQDYLDLTQRQQLHQMVRHMLAGDRPTNDERELVRYITRQFETQLKANQGKQKSN